VTKFLRESWLVLTMSVTFALMLAGAQATFGPKIEANKIAELEQAAVAVIPVEVAQLEKMSVNVENQDKTVFKCLDQGGAIVGWTLVDSDFGFQDKIKLVVGLSSDGSQITGLQVVENTETPGLGNKIAEADWSSQYEGLVAEKDVVVVKGPRSQETNEVSAITGATISSEAVTRIANKVIRQVRPKLDELR